MLDWNKYTAIAECFQHKARCEDREDLKHDIIVRLADVARNNGHKPFTEVAMVEMRESSGLDITILSSTVVRSIGYDLQSDKAFSEFIALMASAVSK